MTGPAPPPLRYTLTAAEFERLTVLTTKRWRESEKPPTAWLLYAVFGAIAAAPLLLVTLGWIEKTPAFLMMLMGGVGYAAGWIAVEHETDQAQARFTRAYGAESEYRDGLELTLDADGAHGVTKGMRWVHLWRPDLSITEADGFVVIWRGRTSLAAVPAHAFPDADAKAGFTAYARAMIAASGEPPAARQD